MATTPITVCLYYYPSPNMNVPRPFVPERIPPATYVDIKRYQLNPPATTEVSIWNAASYALKMFSRCRAADHHDLLAVQKTPEFGNVNVDISDREIIAANTTYHVYVCCNEGHYPRAN